MDRICYMLDPTMRNAEGQFVPAVVKENQSGYFPTDWAWNCANYEAAQKLVDQLNTRMGLSQKDVWEITASSMSASSQLKRAKHTNLKGLCLLMDTKSEDVKEVIRARFTKG